MERWREDLNEREPIGENGERMRVFREGLDPWLSTDGKKTWQKPTIVKEGVPGWEVDVYEEGQWFDVSMGGYLKNNRFENKKADSTIVFDVEKYIKTRFYVTDLKGLYIEKYKSMIKSLPDGEPKIEIEFPSNTISYGRRGEQGTIIRSTVSLYDESGKLLVQSSGDGAISESVPWGNNHGAYYFFPEGRYRVVISNDGNNGVGDESWLLAEVYRQGGSIEPSYEFGQPRRLEAGESCEYWLECYDKGQQNLLFKINNVSR